MSEEKKSTKEKFDWLKNFSFLKKLKQVKHIGLIITIIFILLLVLILFGNFNIFQSNSAISASSKTFTYTTNAEYIKNMEDKLKLLLSKIKGSGKVEVMITLNEGAGVILASNDESITTNNSGNSTTTVSASPIIINQNGTNTPVIVSENIPEIKGVVVVSSGAKDINVKLNILNAVQTLTGLDVNKIQILIGE